MNSESSTPLDFPTPELVTAYKPEVIADSSGQWTPNGLVFRTEAGAQRYCIDLFSRWLAVRDTRVVAVQVPASTINRE